MSDSEILFQTEPQSDLGLITNVGLQVKGIPEVKPAYQWLLDEGTGTSIAECSDNSWNGAYYGNRDIVYSRATSQASRLELDDSNSKIELPYDYHWFADEWTITFWVRPYSRLSKQNASDTGPWPVPNDNGTTYTPASLNNLLSNSIGNFAFGFSSAGTQSQLGEGLGLAGTSVVSRSRFYWDAAYPCVGSPAGWTFIAIRKTYTGTHTYFTVAKDYLGGVGDYMQTNNISGNINWAGSSNSNFILRALNNVAWSDFRVYTKKLTNTQLKTIYTKKKMDVVDWTTKAGNPIHFGLSSYDSGTGIASPDLIRNLQKVNIDFKEDGSEAPIEFVNSPATYPTGGPLPKNKRLWGRGYVDFDYTNDEYINLKNTYLNDYYAQSIATGTNRVRLADGYHQSMNIWVKLNSIGGGKTQFIWSGGNDSGTGTACPDVLFDGSGNLCLYTVGNPAGPGGVLVSYADLPNSVKNGEWFLLSTHYMKQDMLGPATISMGSLSFFINGQWVARVCGNYNNFFSYTDYLARGRNRTNIQGNNNWSYLDGKLSNFCVLFTRFTWMGVPDLSGRPPSTFYAASVVDGATDPYGPRTDAWPSEDKYGQTGRYHEECYTKPMYKLYQELM